MRQTKIPILRNTTVELHVKIDWFEKVQEENKRCNNNENYSWKDCILNYGMKKVGCSLNIFKNSSIFPPCTTQEDVRNTQKYFLSIKDNSWKDLVSTCLSACTEKQYQVVKVIENPIIWKTPWVSEVRFS